MGKPLINGLFHDSWVVAPMTKYLLPQGADVSVAGFPSRFKGWLRPVLSLGMAHGGGKTPLWLQDVEGIAQGGSEGLARVVMGLTLGL